jgi:hypothetical protein
LISGNPFSRKASSSRAGFSSSTMIVFMAIQQRRLQPGPPSTVIPNAEYRRTPSPQANRADARSSEAKRLGRAEARPYNVLARTRLGVANFAFPGIMGRTKPSEEN